MSDRIEENAAVRAGVVPTWFKVAAVAAVLWEVIGCFMYVSQVTADPATLPLDQRAMWEAAPTWMVAAYAIAVWVGLIGAVLLLMRQRLAEPVLLVSLVAVVVQFSALLLVPALRDRTPSDALLGPIIIFVVCYGIWMLSRIARKRGWLR
ncbi:hypothetical protein [Sphingomonas sp. LY160]|uniref:hypothetical protein n=1 Tax=Sphingomonas sp. LY160 TaxID=3095342 RepID=UPI002ADEED5A|nr:hypothetical protein [Sphingomonas sp. LY160]MEA1071941.1 hypothetical protein [Sphingomonas sp. LY160]